MAVEAAVKTLEALKELKKPDFTKDNKAQAILDEFTGLVDRVNEVIGRVNLMDANEIATSKAELQRLAGELGHIKPKLDGYESMIQTIGKGGEFGVSKKALTRLTPPEGMDVVQFNLVAHSAEELTYAGMMRSAALAYGVSKKGQQVGRAYGMSPDWQAALEEFHALNDLVLLIDTMMCVARPHYASNNPDRVRRISRLEIWEDYAAAAKKVRTAALTALDTQTAEEGLEWVPTVFSSELIQLIRAELQVSQLFRHIAMPGETFKVPVLGADTIAYKVSESLEEGADKFPARTFKTRNVTLVAIKHAARMLSSGEINEDSIIPIAPLMLSEIALALGQAEERGILDSDLVTPTHMDSDVVSASDARKSFDMGLRKMALAAGTKKNFNNGPIGIRDFMGMGKMQGRYGRPRNNVVIVGYAGLVELALAKDDAGNQVFLTRKDYGDAAVIIEGELGQINGTPIILSDFMREDLNEEGVYDGVTTDRGAFIRVDRRAIVIGDRRDVTLAASRDLYMETDQTVAVGTRRLDMKAWYKQPDEKIVSLGYNINAKLSE